MLEYFDLDKFPSIRVGLRIYSLPDCIVLRELPRIDFEQLRKGKYIIRDLDYFLAGYGQPTYGEYAKESKKLKTSRLVCTLRQHGWLLP
jgi:hypothetical protein